MKAFVQAILDLFRRTPVPAPPPAPVSPPVPTRGWNMSGAGLLLYSPRATELARQMGVDLIRFGGTASQYLETMSDARMQADAYHAVGAKGLLYVANINDRVDDRETVREIRDLLDYGVNIRGVELGNESYLPAYQENYPYGDIYLDRAESLRDRIKERFPNLPCGVVMAPSEGMRDPESNTGRRYPRRLKEWNNLVLGETWPDAFIVHSYVTDLTAKGHVAALEGFVTGLGGREVWITEAGWQGSLLAADKATHLANVDLRMARCPEVKVLLYHSLVGWGLHAAIRVGRKGEAQLTEFGTLMQ